MGTSSSSSGPGSGLPLDPPWLEYLMSNVISGAGALNTPIPPLENSPERRFFGARTNLGKYGDSGGSESLRRALGHYSKNGYGGSKNLASRMRVSSAVGTGIFGLLDAARSQISGNAHQWLSDLQSKSLSCYEVADKIAENLMKIGGSLDEESCRNSVALSIGEFLDTNPNTDLCNLTDDQIWGVIQSFISYEALHRIELDIGQMFESSEVSVADKVLRLNEMHDYLKSAIASNVEETRRIYQNPSLQQVFDIINKSIEDTFYVFEGEI